ncbi:MAG: hypothetical protein O7C56_02210, partial [Rickettsia endosymbiont of Ixodes persulcatus]|nr:hypothetical protein [Rickettsia endosymbiont of Ixodes persulcatus]
GPRSRPSASRNIAFNLYDWDKVSSNDHVGDVVVPLEQLLGTTVQPDERGLYPAGSDGKLIGDDFHPHDLKIVIDGKESGEREVDGKTPSTLQIRAKFTPYSVSRRSKHSADGADLRSRSGALRQQFWRVYLRNYDIDESGTFSHIEIFSMLDSLGSTLTKETISSFFTRFNKTEDQELTMDQVVICLEQEVTKPKEEKRRVDESANSTAASTANSMPGTPGAKPASLSFTKPDAGAGAKPDQTDPSSNMQPIQPGAEIVTNVEQGTKISVPASRAAPARQDSLDPLADDSDSLGEKVERVVNIKECPLCHKPRMNSKAELGACQVKGNVPSPVADFVSVHRHHYTHGSLLFD